MYSRTMLFGPFKDFLVAFQNFDIWAPGVESKNLKYRVGEQNFDQFLIRFPVNGCRSPVKMVVISVIFDNIRNGRSKKVITIAKGAFTSICFVSMT